MTEPILSAGLLPAAMLTIWATLMVTAIRERTPMAWWTEAPAAATAGGVVGLLTFALVVLGPSGGIEGTAWLARICASFAVAGALFAWPLLVLRRARRRPVDDWVSEMAQGGAAGVARARRT